MKPESRLARIATRFTSWAERWIPDAYVFALLATVMVVLAGWLTRVRTQGTWHAAHDVVQAWGSGLWDLLPFTMQMSLVIITGHVLASTPPVHSLIQRLARVPKTSRQASAWVAFLAMLTAWFNWGFSLIFSALLARQTARRVPSADYRTLCASALLGLGSVWAQGLSGSAALQMATQSALSKETRAIIAHGTLVPQGVIPLSKTIFLWQSLLSVAIEMIVVVIVIALATPDDSRSINAAQLGIALDEQEHTVHEVPKPTRPGEVLEHARWMGWIFAALSFVALAVHVHEARHKSGVLAAIDLNTINLLFLALGTALHQTPARLMRAFREATSGVWGVMLQFPLYAGIAAVIVKTGLNEKLVAAFTSISTRETFPAVVAVYSAVLGVFVPSGGSKWVIEAPYVMKASHDLHVNLGWSVAVYDLGEALANLVQPFWMLPVLGVFGLRARDVMGVTFLVFLVLTPLVLVMVTVLGLTLPYP